MFKRGLLFAIVLLLVAGADLSTAQDSDNSLIVFLSGSSGDFTLYTMNADGSNVQTLTTTRVHHIPAHVQTCPPIFFYTLGEDERKYINIINLDGSGEQQIAYAYSYQALENNYASIDHLSPNGSQIAYLSTADEETQNDGLIHTPDLYIMNRDGSNLRHIPLHTKAEDAVTDFAWSPDGTRFAFVYAPHAFGPVVEQTLYLMNVDGSNLYPLVDTSSGSFPQWSPNGTQIAFERVIADFHARTIYIINADGTGLRELIPTEPFTNNYYPFWSPDGTQILYLSLANGKATLNVVDVTTGTTHPLVTEASFIIHYQWSPDSTQIVFDSRIDGEIEIFVMNRDGTIRYQLTHTSGIYDSPVAWIDPDQCP